MAQYKYQQFLKHNTNTAFDAQHLPGASTPYSGVYGCVFVVKRMCLPRGIRCRRRTITSTLPGAVLFVGN